MKISIVVPAFNEEKLLSETLIAIQKAASGFVENGCEWELIVCDNNSTDRTAEVAVAAGARLAFEPINQIGRARNSGAGIATGEWLIFIDADSHPSRGLLQDVLREIKSGRTLAGGATLSMVTDSWFAQGLIRFWNMVSQIKKQFAGSFIFIDAAAFRELGGFDTSLYASEEIDLSKRANRLARRWGKRVRILNQHPLVTSARKLHLYTPREHLRFLGRTLLERGGTLRRRESCGIWYDGRR